MGARYVVRRLATRSEFTFTVHIYTSARTAARGRPVKFMPPRAHFDTRRGRRARRLTRHRQRQRHLAWDSATKYAATVPPAAVPRRAALPFAAIPPAAAAYLPVAAGA